ncbi:MAG: nicotinamide-nucleotide adenylyltransferase [Comamonadaceae bacterium CG12_big_fil_rev_8_21_14_0_65_59_15]|nr:MAG: nicotinamide-nucleotide adenylyltransferase [Comamonadaceae bacterium CG12_big_fil_rev_8_21_14_0_65_59_15]
MNPLLICLIGAECCGKSTLAQVLAQHFGGVVAPEALRLFCDRHDRTPTQAEQSSLIDAQLALEAQALVFAKQQRFTFCDSAPLMTAVYSDHYFADTSLYVQALRLHQRYALTLWLQPDLPWVADGNWRDGPAARIQVHTLLARALGQVHPVVAVAGQGVARVQCAVAAISSLSRAD